MLNFRNAHTHVYVYIYIYIYVCVQSIYCREYLRNNLALAKSPWCMFDTRNKEYPFYTPAIWKISPTLHIQTWTSIIDKDGMICSFKEPMILGQTNKRNVGHVQSYCCLKEVKGEPKACPMNLWWRMIYLDAYINGLFSNKKNPWDWYW